MANLLTTINQAKTNSQADNFSAEQIKFYEACYDEIVAKGLEANPKKPPDTSRKKRGAPKQTPAYNMLRRLRDYKKEVLAFMHNFRVPFTNNQAEQDVRMIKVKQKVSGCFRTLEGAEEFAESRAYISTSRKNNENVFQSIKTAFDSRPFVSQSVCF